MEYGLLTYEMERRHFNLGDYIQSLAAQQYLPRTDRLLNRENLSSYQGEKVKLIMNGWFMNHPENWPPSSAIEPLFLSFHLESPGADRLLDPDNIGYLKRHQPIGCRDRATVKRLRERDVEAYYSACLTLTLGQTYHADGASGKIYFIDLFYMEPSWKRSFSSINRFRRSVQTGKLFHPFAKARAMQKLFAPAEKIHYRTHYLLCSEYPEVESRLKTAHARLDELSHAQLVVTSRIHCALPCLAMGTPVVFVASGFKPEETAGRIEDFFAFFHTLFVAPDGTVSANFDVKAMFKPGFCNPDRHLPYAEKLRRCCRAFIAGEQAAL